MARAAILTFLEQISSWPDIIADADGFTLLKSLPTPVAGLPAFNDGLIVKLEQTHAILLAGQRVQ